MIEDSSSERPMVWKRCKPPRLNCVEGMGVGIEPYVRILSFSSPSLVLSYVYVRARFCLSKSHGNVLFPMSVESHHLIYRPDYYFISHCAQFSSVYRDSILKCYNLFPRPIFISVSPRRLDFPLISANFQYRSILGPINFLPFRSLACSASSMLQRTAIYHSVWRRRIDV